MSGGSKEKVHAGKVKSVVTIEWLSKCLKLFFLNIGRNKRKRRGSFEDEQLKSAHRNAASVCSFVYSGLIQPKWEPMNLKSEEKEPNIVSLSKGEQ